MENVNYAVPAIARDIGKKKRANRSAKLKQCKLDAKREQWLSQVKMNECKSENIYASPTSPLQPTSESKSIKGEHSRKAPSTPSEHVKIVNQENINSDLPKQNNNTPSKKGINTDNNIGGSSSGSSIGSYSRSVSDEEENESYENEGDGLDDWETIADALSMSSNNDHEPNPSSIELVDDNSLSPQERISEPTKHEPEPTVPRAWRPDDVFRPQSLPNLTKHMSFPLERHFDVSHKLHGILNPPSSCPICYEDLDLTDSSFLPCDCGFHICLFCHKRILEDDARCPGCRKLYNSKHAGEEIGIITGVGGPPLVYKISRSCSMGTRSCRRARINNGVPNSESKVKTVPEVKTPKKLRRNQSDSNVEKEKSKGIWKPPETNCKSPIQLRKAASDLSNSPKNGHEVSKVEELDDDEIEIEGVINNFNDKEIDLPTEKQDNVLDENNQSLVIYHQETEPDLMEAEEEMMGHDYNSPNKIQYIVDLIMWRDVSRSCFVFGFGSFMLLSSSYTKDLNFSLLSAISYLGLVYLALVFIYRSILMRGEEDYKESEVDSIIREEDIICILRILLPYINEVLVKIKALFSGGPQTTIKLAVVLFVMARCGNSITMPTFCKLLFFGVFTVPKVFSSYSVQLARYGKFWIERFREAWESCTQKKAVAATVFIFIWNISSTVARVWAVFILVVGVKLFKEHYGMEWFEEKEEAEETQEKGESVKNIIQCNSSEVAAKEKNIVMKDNKVDKQWCNNTGTKDLCRREGK